MRELSAQNGALIGPDSMHLGTLLPSEAEVSALVAAIRENAERRALAKDTPEERWAFLETYVPLAYEDFCKVVRDYDGLLIELADEEKREQDERQRVKRALEDREIELEERELERAERHHGERVQRREDDEIQDGFLYREAKNRQKLFDTREALLIKKQRISDERFTVEDPDYEPRKLIIGLDRFMREGGAANYSPTLESYKDYLRSLGDGYSDAVNSLHINSAFPEEIRNFHSLVVAPTGWGKSELLKQIMFHYVKHQSAGVLLLDPGGDLARQVMRWPELVETDRLVVVDPQIARGLTVGINPFDGLGIRDEDDRKALASEWSHILGAITDDITPHMRRVIINCIRVLLGWHKSATLMDLKYLLGDPEQAPKTGNKDLQDTFGSGRKADPLALARLRRKGELHEFARNHPDLEVRSFFREEFDSLSVTSTRQSLRARIDIVMQIPFAQAMLVGKQTLDLGRVLDERKIVVVNLESFGSEKDIKAIGCLFLGMVSAIGRKRGAESMERRVPIQVIVDEAAMLASPVVMEILTRLRKYRVHLTLAQQITEGLSLEHRAALASCTRVKMVAPATRETAEMLGLDRKLPEFKALADRQFWVRWGEKAEPVRLAVGSGLADDSHRVSPEAFRGHLDRGKATGLYREATEPPTLALEPALPALPAPEPAATEEPPAAAEKPPTEAAPSPAEPKPVKRPTKATKPASTTRRKTATAAKPKLFPAPETGGE